MNPTRDDLEHYVLGDYDGDVAGLEAHLAADPAAREVVAELAAFDELLREAGAAATFCAGCDDIVTGDRCDACGAAVHPGGYVVERVLVSNAHGRMYVAHDVDGKQVALKELAFVQPPGSGAVAAFEREAAFLRALEHAGIPRFCASFEEGRGVHTRYYLAQELVAGRALDDRLADHFYTENEIIDVARQVLTILVYLQSLAPMVVHRDIKPANLIARADGSIALVDFGAAYVHGTTVGSTTIGTFGYMPVEQMAGQVDATTDGYALGASLLHLLTRSEPWKLLQRAELGPINVSAPVRQFLEKLTAPDPRDRFASAAAALEQLERIARGEVAVAVAARPPRPPRRILRTLGLAALALAALTGTGVFAVFLWSAIHEPDARELVPAIAPLAPGDPAPWGGKVPSTPAYHLPAGAPIDVQLARMPLAEVIRFFGKSCSYNLVLPDYIQASVTVDLHQVPCDQAFEVVLESYGLWYDYQPDVGLIRIAPRKQLDAEAQERVERRKVRAVLGLADDVLPPGKTASLDFRDAPLTDVIKLLANVGGVSVMVPESIQGKVTVRLDEVPWERALSAILAAHGLGLRYRENGKLVRIAPQKEIDAEDMVEAERRGPPGEPALAPAPP